MTTHVMRQQQRRLVAVPAAPRPALPCQATQDDLWFADAPADLERAKRLCLSCPIQAQCLAGALRREEACGVWGGQIIERGAVIPFKRPPGRPRKAG